MFFEERLSGKLIDFHNAGCTHELSIMTGV